MAEQRRRHALESFLVRTGEQPSTENRGVAMAISPFRGFLNLRGDPNDAGFLQAVREGLGQPLPIVANRFTEGACRVFWLGPDEWLAMTAPGEEAALGKRLADALAGRVCALTDLTGGQICIRLSGENVRDALAKGCTLDLHPRVFKPGHCAQTVLGKASMLIGLSGTVDDSAGGSLADADASSATEGEVVSGEVFHIVVRRTFAEYAAWWLYRSALEYGVSVDCD